MEYSEQMRLLTEYGNDDWCGYDSPTELKFIPEEFHILGRDHIRIDYNKRYTYDGPERARKDTSLKYLKNVKKRGLKGNNSRFIIEMIKNPLTPVEWLVEFIEDNDLEEHNQVLIQGRAVENSRVPLDRLTEYVDKVTKSKVLKFLFEQSLSRNSALTLELAEKLLHTGKPSVMSGLCLNLSLPSWLRIEAYKILLTANTPFKDRESWVTLYLAPAAVSVMNSINLPEDVRDLTIDTQVDSHRRVLQDIDSGITTNTYWSEWIWYILTQKDATTTMLQKILNIYPILDDMSSIYMLEYENCPTYYYAQQCLRYYPEDINGLEVKMKESVKRVRNMLREDGIDDVIIGTLPSEALLEFAAGLR